MRKIGIEWSLALGILSLCVGIFGSFYAGLRIGVEYGSNTLYDAHRPNWACDFGEVVTLDGVCTELSTLIN